MQYNPDSDKKASAHDWFIKVNYGEGWKGQYIGEFLLEEDKFAFDYLIEGIDPYSDKGFKHFGSEKYLLTDKIKNLTNGEMYDYLYQMFENVDCVVYHIDPV